MKKYLLLGITISLLLLAGGWFAVSHFLVPSITVARPVRGPAVYAVYATGTVEATVMLPVAPRTSARLMELLADEGDHVRKGQVLARLEDNDLQKSIEQLRAKRIYAQRTYERSNTLVQNGFISKDELDRSKADWLAAKAAVEQIEAQAGFLKLVAPEDSIIIRRDGEIGQLIPVNEPVFWLSCCAPLRISAEVDEEDAPQVKPGQSVLIRADAFPGQVFHGKVQSITPKGDPIARSYRVRISFAGDMPLQIGMTAETNIVIREHQNAILLPTIAVKDSTVWLVEEGRIKQQQVTVGAKGPEQVEIKSGISDDALVMLKPDPSLKTGRRVRVMLKDKE